MSQITNVMYFLAGYIKESYDEIYKPLEEWLNAIVEENADFEGGRAYFVNDNVYDIGYDFKYNFEDLLYTLITCNYTYKYIKHIIKTFDKNNFNNITNVNDVYDIIHNKQMYEHHITATIIIWQILYNVYNFTSTLPFNYHATKLISINDEHEIFHLILSLYHINNNYNNVHIKSVVYNIMKHNKDIINNYIDYILPCDFNEYLDIACNHYMCDYDLIYKWLFNLEYNNEYTKISIINNIIEYANEHKYDDTYDIFDDKNINVDIKILPKNINDIYKYLIQEFMNIKYKHILVICTIILYTKLHI